MENDLLGATSADLRGLTLYPTDGSMDRVGLGLAHGRPGSEAHMKRATPHVGPAVGPYCTWASAASASDNQKIMSMAP
jgi:hypothetical protein